MDLKAKSYVGHGDLGCDKMKAHMEEAFAHGKLEGKSVTKK